MSKAWIRAKRHEFARDAIRNFCLVTQELESCFQEYDATGRIRFDALRDLIGVEMNKGLLWRLKDTSHHLFRHEPDMSELGLLLDWGLGYIFHETMKLKEDAYQQQVYSPWFRELEQADLSPEERHFRQELTQILDQTSESIAREVRRIRYITEQLRAMFPLFYARFNDNVLLARFLVSYNDLARSVFGAHYQQLMDGIYGDKPETMYTLAAQSLRLGGWAEEAAKAVSEALRLRPGCPDANEEMKLQATMRSQRRRTGTA